MPAAVEYEAGAGALRGGALDVQGHHAGQRAGGDPRDAVRGPLLGLLAGLRQLHVRDPAGALQIHADGSADPAGDEGEDHGSQHEHPDGALAPLLPGGDGGAGLVEGAGVAAQGS
uniref:Uncharacterized protein n=1 Tax=Streptomyces avermitilis TaxID=33903 RepID=A0A499VN01_STRAX|nr:hypothetical protein SAVMC3_36000 [Streptomyces avermitilis]